jgi:hypothetical protein
MTSAESGFAAFGEPVAREVYAPGLALWLRVGGTVRRAGQRLISLPDQGVVAKPLPPEFFRFPPF